MRVIWHCKIFDSTPAAPIRVNWMWSRNSSKIFCKSSKGVKAMLRLHIMVVAVISTKSDGG